MKKLSYVVYVHLNQVTGDVVHVRQEREADVNVSLLCYAMLYQIIDYVQLELLEVPDFFTCTQVLQQWNVPSGQASALSFLKI